MNHERRAAIAEQRMTVVSESHVFVDNRELGAAFGVNSEVIHVAGVVAFRIFQAVLLSRRD